MSINGGKSDQHTVSGINVPKRNTSSRSKNQGDCRVCNMPDNDDMVACDKCHIWFHFVCVNVTEDIENHDWVCDNCKSDTTQEGNDKQNQGDVPINTLVTQSSTTGQNNKGSNKGSDTHSITSSKQRQLKLKLMQLEEERLMQERRDKEFLEKKYKLLELYDDQENSEDEEENKDDHGDEGKGQSNVEKVAVWLHDQPNQSTKHQERSNNVKIIANKDVPKLVGTYQDGRHDVNVRQIRLDNSRKLQKGPCQINNGTTSNQMMCGNMNCEEIENVNRTFGSRYQPREFSNIFGTNQSVKTSIHHPQGCDSQQTHNYYRNDDMPIRTVHKLNSQQLASRHVISKELPSFNGNPEDWPLFFSTYMSSSKTCGFSDEENLVRLQKCLKGRALEAVRSRLLIPENVKDVIETLRMLFGRPELIINIMLKKIRNEPAPRIDKMDTLISYALSVQNLCGVMEASGLQAYLNNPLLIHELVDKLPATIKLDWGTYKAITPFVTLSTLSNWLTKLAHAANEVSTTVDFSNEFKIEKRQNKKGYLNAHSSNNREDNISKNQVHFLKRDSQIKRCCICLNDCATVEECKIFESLSYNEKWNRVKSNHLCRKCLRPHQKSKCKRESICGIHGCTYKHHRLLHNLKKNDSVSDIDTLKSNETSITNGPCHMHLRDKSDTLFRVVPVILRGNNTQLKTYAFLDDGSSLTLLDEQLAQDLNLEGQIQPICLKWTGNTHRKEDGSRKLSIQISADTKNSKIYCMKNVHTVKSLNLPIQSLNVKSLSSSFPHLQRLPLQSYNNAVPRILIGIDNLKLQVPLKVHEGVDDDESVVAVKTRLGWCVYGCQYRPETASALSQYNNLHVCECEKYSNDDLHDLMKQYYSLEGLPSISNRFKLESPDEKYARRLMETTVKKADNRYEIGLLWKFPNVELPNSLPMARSRLDCLKRRLAKDPALKKILEQQIRDYVDKGYAHKITEEEMQSSPRVWYLPMFPVRSQSKPEKVRMVWDAAASVENVSLNSVLHKGPDLLVPLLFVLYKFRERRVAICGDIKEMYHQIQISQQDRQARRFLWPNDDPLQPPDVFVMDVMTFGASCSPSCAQYIKNKNALEYENQFPRAVSAILDNHYVDDWLDSFNNDDEAIKIANEVKMIHTKAGFEIRNWKSNSKNVVRALGGCSDQNQDKSLVMSEEVEAEKVLGLWWCTSSDQLKFVLQLNKSLQALLTGNKRPTKREILRTSMTIFDPLGILASFMIYLKIILQEIWRKGTGWDEYLPEPLYQKWMKWIAMLPIIETVQIPRQYFQMKIDHNSNIQLHIFVDASEEAYAAVGYFRCQTNDQIQCSFIAAKTRVSPIKPLSVPRLELEAALLGTKLAQNIVSGHSLKISSKTFWSDSKCVLSWLKSANPKKYRQFVSYRIGEILEATNTTEWKWISSKLNVADEATKWERKPNLQPNSRWICGPDFLWLREESWEYHEIAIDTNEEIKSFHTLHHNIVPVQIIDYSRFSTWNRLLRSMSYVFKFIWSRKINYHRTRVITTHEYQSAENYLYSICQREEFSEELNILNKTNGCKIVKKSSRIYKLNPHVDKFGVIRAWGRVDGITYVGNNFKRPVILPQKHYITELIVMHYHVKYHHKNHETVINELRQDYYIPCMRVVLKQQRNKCQSCKNSNAQPVPPRMADLPKCRTTPFTRPFTFVGVDFFGPMVVALGRRNEKRWGMMFTCLTVRAVHIEIAHSLTTDACILCLKNFTSRRGTPAEIYSDNGTNFHGAERELRIAMKDVDQNQLMKQFVTSNTVWHFNPPCSPHMGGSWERLVRSFKSSLYKILPCRKPSDALLQSTLIQIEHIINSRPLTYMPLEFENDEALTPNHFLLGSTSGYKPVGHFTDENAVMRKNWLTSQQLADAFWRRWIREYLPTITRRSKWFDKAPKLSVGDAVIIVDDQNPRNLWPKGRILKTFTGADGEIRKVTVQTMTGIYDRPAVKIAILDVLNSDKTSKTVLSGGSVTECPSTSINGLNQ